MSVALTKSGENIQVKQKSELEKDYFESGTVLDPESMLLFARDLKAKVFVMGQISLSGSNTLVLLVNAYRSDNGKGITALKVTLRLTEEMASSMAKIVTDNYPKAGTAGYSVPKCGYCPRADYTNEAATRKIQGVVELMAIVGTDGHLRNISVSQGLPGGLTFQAIKASHNGNWFLLLDPTGSLLRCGRSLRSHFSSFHNEFFLATLFRSSS